jgi:serine/threonine protein kinase
MADGNLFSTSCGSPNYAAPEVISGKLYAGPEVDVWSCGIILYVMLTGKLPFDDVYIPSLFKKINDGAFQIPSYVSKEAADLLRSLIVVNPLDRITLAEAAYSPWVQAGVVSNILSQSHAVPSYGLLNEINMDAVKIVSEKLKVPVEKVLKIVEKLSPIISEGMWYLVNS